MPPPERPPCARFDARLGDGRQAHCHGFTVAAMASGRCPQCALVLGAGERGDGVFNLRASGPEKKTPAGAFWNG